MQHHDPAAPKSAALGRRAALAAAAAIAATGALAALATSLLPAAPLAILYAAAEACWAVVYARKHRLLCSKGALRDPPAAAATMAAAAGGKTPTAFSDCPAGPQEGGSPEEADDPYHRPLTYCPSAAFAKALEHLRQLEDPRAFLSQWFRGVPYAELARDDVEELLAYAFFYSTADGVRSAGRGAELAAMVGQLERTWGLELPEGRGGKHQFMAHLRQPLIHMWRPLAFYGCMEAAAAVRHAALAAAGFRRRRCNGFTYYIRPGSGDTGDTSDVGDAGDAGQPLLLLHGVGMGLFPYIGFLMHLAATGRAVIAVEFKHVAMRWTAQVPTVRQSADAAATILAAEGVGAAAVVAHSYGTAVAAALLRGAPERVAHLTLIDPVCFAPFMPRLLRAFLYDSPGTGSALGDFAMASAARELHVSAAISRGFYWTDIVLWEHQVPPGTLVVLSGRDSLVAAQEVRCWLQWHTEAEVMLHPTLRHAGFLLATDWQRTIVDRLTALHAAAPRAATAAAATADAAEVTGVAAAAGGQKQMQQEGGQEQQQASHAPWQWRWQPSGASRWQGCSTGSCACGPAGPRPLFPVTGLAPGDVTIHGGSAAASALFAANCAAIASSSPGTTPLDAASPRAAAALDASTAEVCISTYNSSSGSNSKDLLQTPPSSVKGVRRWVLVRRAVSGASGAAAAAAAAAAEEAQPLLIPSVLSR